MTRGWAPEARAAARARRPIGPAPQITAGVPRVIGAEFMPWRTTLRGSRRAPSAKETLSGSLKVISSSMLSCLRIPLCHTYEAIWQDEPCIAAEFLHKGRPRRTVHLHRDCIGRLYTESNDRKELQAQQPLGRLEIRISNNTSF